MTLGYYPGCSLHGTAREYDESVRRTARALGIDLCEMDGWTCCGATSAHTVNPLLALALPARNLALAESAGHAEVMAPCAACFNRLARASHAVAADADLAGRMPGIIGRPFSNSVRVLSILDVLREAIPTIRAKAAHPLTGMKVACYYGCLLMRPPEVCSGDDPECPTSMEDVARAVGAEPVAWNMRLECCGGSLSIPHTGSVVRLGRAILDDARGCGAEALVVACPMCHSNLDFRQHAMVSRSAPGIPVLYLTELVGLALGLRAGDLGLGRHFVDPRPLLEKVSAEREAA